MFLWLKTLYRKRAVTWPFIFYTIIWTLSAKLLTGFSEDKIRMFLSKTKRKQELNELLLSGHLVDFKENNLFAMS